MRLFLVCTVNGLPFSPITEITSLTESFPMFLSLWNKFMIRRNKTLLWAVIGLEKAILKLPPSSFNRVALMKNRSRSQWGRRRYTSR